jgi:flagellar L-ring protein precursor FlgH
MMNKFVLTTFVSLGAAGVACADSGIGSVWGHPTGAAQPCMSAAASIYGDPLAHSVGDLVTIVVDLQNTLAKAQQTKTSKDTALTAVLNSLLYPTDSTNHGYNFLNYHGANPTTSWSSTQSFNGGGTVNNTETASTTIQAKVIEVLPNGVLRVAASRMSRAGQEDTSMVLTGLVRPDDLSTSNTIASSRVADLEILQKGKGTLTDDQKKGWLTKFYEFIEPF